MSTYYLVCVTSPPEAFSLGYYDLVLCGLITVSQNEICIKCMLFPAYLGGGNTNKNDLYWKLYRKNQKARWSSLTLVTTLYYHLNNPRSGEKHLKTCRVSLHTSFVL